LAFANQSGDRRQPPRFSNIGQLSARRAIQPRFLLGELRLGEFVKAADDQQQRQQDPDDGNKDS
jgi:hypothetical protein